jgi:hypothetical protein
MISYLEMAMHAVTKAYPHYWPGYYTEDMHAQKSAPRTPVELFPVFHRAYDWHSCVHGFWCMIRILKESSDIPADRRSAALTLIRTELTAKNIAGELTTFELPQYRAFERPYGLGWACMLAAELHTWLDRPDPALAGVMLPLAKLAAERIITWHERLPYPIQTGEHNQSAFGLELLRRYAETFDAPELTARIDREIQRLYAPRVLSILHAEPSGHDFLSPSLGRAMVVRHVMPPTDYAGWLEHFFPQLRADVPAADWLTPAAGHDAADGKLSHLIGLNLSRAWMMRQIAGRLPTGEKRRSVLLASADQHLRTAEAAIDPHHFASSHWLATFAVLAISDT